LEEDPAVRASLSRLLERLESQAGMTALSAAG